MGKTVTLPDSGIQATIVEFSSDGTLVLLVYEDGRFGWWPVGMFPELPQPAQGVGDSGVPRTSTA